MNNLILLATVFTGYNYGSSLQAFAGKMFIEQLGYDCKIVAKRSLLKGYNIQVAKLFIMLYRTISLRGKNKSFSTFKKQYTKKLIGLSTGLFDKFIEEHLCPCYLSWTDLKKIARQCTACLAGSDQIWNSTTLYIDPLYYLRFAPEYKRIAFAPSFGRDFIPDYNEKKLAHWVASFSCLSAREDMGVKLIKRATGRDSIQLIDPTLMLDREEWTKHLDLKIREDEYLLAYFLDEPSPKAKKIIWQLAKTMGCKVMAIPYKFSNMDYCNEMVEAGPKEFLEIIGGAKFVCTDSFHGMAFSINFHTPFYVFERNYGSAQKQSSRILSLLTQMCMLHRYEVSELNDDQIDFSYSDAVLAKEREKARQYVLTSISHCMKKDHSA